MGVLYDSVVGMEGWKVQTGSGGRAFVCLRQEMLRAGDVLLVRNSGREARAIGLSHPSGFSHAALFLDRTRCFEADGHGVGVARSALCHSRVDGGGVIVLPATKAAAVLRHPALQERLANPTFESDLTIGLEAIVGRKVQPYSRLGRLSRAAGSLEPAAEIVLNAMDFYEVIKQDRSSSRTMRDEGRFCSEVVVEVLTEVGVPVFRDGREASQVGPGHLTESALADISEAVVVSRSLEQLGLPETAVQEEIGRYQRERELVGMQVAWSLIQRRDEEAAEVSIDGEEDGSRIDEVREKVNRCREVLEDLEGEARRFRLEQHERMARKLRAAADSALEHAGERAELVREVAGFVAEFDLLKARASVAALRRKGQEVAAARVQMRVEQLRRLLGE